MTDNFRDALAKSGLRPVEFCDLVQELTPDGYRPPASTVTRWKDPKLGGFAKPGAHDYATALLNMYNQWKQLVADYEKLREEKRP